MTQLVSISNLNQGGFCQLPQKDRTYRSIFTLSAKFCLQESRLSDQFLEGRKLLGTFLSKGRKFYIIAFLTFLSQHFDQERKGFCFQSKHRSERELNLWPRSIFTLVQISSYKTCCLWQCDFGVYHFYLLTFFYLISFLVAFAFTLSALSLFRLIEHGKQIIGKPMCIERDERHGTWQDTTIGQLTGQKLRSVLLAKPGWSSKEQLCLLNWRVRRIR